MIDGFKAADRGQLIMANRLSTVEMTGPDKVWDVGAEIGTLRNESLRPMRVSSPVACSNIDGFA